MVDEMELSSISSTIAAVVVWQYLMLYVQFCAPDDGRRNRLKTVHRASGISKPILLPAAMVDEMELSSISSTIAAVLV
jgi:hypothetical protein